MVFFYSQNCFSLQTSAGFVWTLLNFSLSLYFFKTDFQQSDSMNNAKASTKKNPAALCPFDLAHVFTPVRSNGIISETNVYKKQNPGSL